MQRIPVVIDARGGRGGNGGDGGRGGSGGMGSPSGRDGARGAGGDGGDGGDGGEVILTTHDAHLLAVVDEVRVSGGHAGRGGSGDPRGSDGRRGRDGSYAFQAHNAKTGEIEEDSEFGLSPDDLALECDSTRLADNFTRGSTFRITRAKLSNPSNISILAPWMLAFSTESPIEVGENIVGNERIDANAHETIEVPCDVEARIRPQSDIGWFALRTAVVSARGDVSLHLNHRKKDGTLRLAVNHRLVEGEVRLVDPSDAEALQTLIAELNPAPPERQTVYFTASVLREIARGKPVRQREALSRTLQGTLLEPQALWTEMDGASPAAQRVAFAAALHFFRSLPLDTRTKALDAAYFIACQDRILEPEEKAILHRFATETGVPEAWVAENMPRVVEEGTSRATATRTNWLAAFALPVFITLLFLAAAWSVPSLGELVRVAATSRVWPLHGGLWLLVAALALQPYRLLCFRTACRSCGSQNLKPVGVERQKSTMIGSADVLRCVDCGARGNTVEGDPAELASSDCGLAVSSNALRVGAAIALALALALVVALVEHSARGPALLPALSGMALLALVSTLVVRGARRLGGGVLLVAGVLGSGLVGYEVWDVHRDLSRIVPAPEPVAPVAAEPAPPPPPSPTYKVVANTHGEGVFLRQSPEAVDRLRAVAEGTTLQVSGATKTAKGMEWTEVQVPEGSAWVPSKYLAEAAPSAAASQPPSP